MKIAMYFSFVEKFRTFMNFTMITDSEFLEYIRAFWEKQNYHSHEWFIRNSIFITQKITI